MFEFLTCSKCGWKYTSIQKFCSMCGNTLTEIETHAPEIVFLDESFYLKFKTKGSVRYNLVNISHKGKEIFKPIDKSESIIDNKLKDYEVVLKSQGSQVIDIKFKQEDVRSKVYVINPAESELVVGDFQRVFLKHHKKKPRVLISSYWESKDAKIHFTEPHLNKFFGLSIGLGDKRFKLEKLKEGEDYSFHFSEQDLGEIKKITDKAEVTESILFVRCSDFFEAPFPIVIGFVNLPIFSLESLSQLRDDNFFIIQGEDKKFELVYRLNIDETKGSCLSSFVVKAESKAVEVLQVSDFFSDKNTIELKIAIEFQKIESFYLERKDNLTVFRLVLNISFATIFGDSFEKAETIGIRVKDPDKIESVEILSLDFGTTNSCVCFNHNGKMQSLDFNDILGSGVFLSSEIPTFLQFELFSNDLLTHKTKILDYDIGSSLPKTYALAFKSLIPYNTERVYYDFMDSLRLLSPLEITKIYIHHIFQAIKQSKFLKITNVNMSFPVNFSQKTKKRLFNTVRELGCDVKEEYCISEPEAIALHYIFQDKITIDEKPLTIAVFDCGGGTTDIAIVRYSRENETENIRVLATWATDYFGGNYLSWLLARSLEEPERYPDSFEELLHESFDNLKVKHFYDKLPYLQGKKQKLSEEISKAKTLGQQKIIDVLSKQKFLDPNKTYKELIGDITKNLEIVQTILARLWDEKAVDSLAPDYLILAGNSCRLPLFHSCAKELFEDSIIIDDEDKKIAVSKGLLDLYVKFANADINLKGLSLSQNAFFIISGLKSITKVFPMWIPRLEETVFMVTGKKYKSDIKIYYSNDIMKSSITINDLKEAFSVPLEQVSGKETETLYLKYYDFKISYKWQIKLESGEEYETEYKEIYETV